MQLRTFNVTFSEVVGEDATELEFGPDDYLVVRPLYSLPRGEIAAWVERSKAAETTEASDALILDLLAATVTEWRLTGPDGPIEQPRTPEALNALPGAIVGALFPFLTSYRGRSPNLGTRH